MQLARPLFALIPCLLACPVWSRGGAPGGEKVQTRTQVKEATPVAAAPVVAAGPRTVNGAWFSLAVPASWEERPPRNDAERGVSEGMWRTPGGVPPVNILVGQPVPFAGDVDEFAAQSLFAFAEMGLGTMRADGEAQLGEIAARRYRGTLSMMGKTREVAYWFFVREGSGVTLQCGGEAQGWIELCAEIAASFRVTGPVPQVSAALPVTTVSLRELPGYAAELRDDWQMFSTVQYPDAVFQLRALAPVAGQFPSAVLRRRPWAGGKRWDVGVEQEIAGEEAKLRKREAVTFLGEKTTLLEVEVPPKHGGYVALVTGIVKDGEETRLSCAASPLVIEALRPDCLRMISSLKRRP